ncbi:MAG: hypothetical protein KDD52_03645 [Bdellovibrionales bacterium]|nr:hypothetical protein [Bdellovibrionales bacterium]
MRKTWVKVSVWILTFAFVSMGLRFSPDLLQAYGDQIPIRVKSFEFAGLAHTPISTLESIARKFFDQALFGSWSVDFVDEIKALPQVKSVWLIRDMTGKVRVHIDEREAVAMVEADRWYLVDDEGGLMGPLEDLERDLILISGPWKAELDVRRGREKIYEALTLYSVLVTEGVDESGISQIHFDEGLGEWMIFLNQIDLPIHLGRGNLAEKATHVAQILPDLMTMSQRIDSVDARFDDRIVIKINN